MCTVDKLEFWKTVFVSKVDAVYSTWRTFLGRVSKQLVRGPFVEAKLECC